MQRNILEYLEQTVLHLPDKIAYSTGEEHLTFGELSHAAKAVGSFLLGRGLSREPVVIYMEKHPKEVAAFFGTVYAGCFYVPVDAEMPRHRVELIFENLHPRAVICDEATEEAALSLAGKEKCFLYDEAASAPVDEAALAAVRAAQIDTDPIYIVFTSGSTGVPKGVCACHRSVIDYIENLSEVLGFNENTVFANQTPLYFDAPLKELMPVIKFGATAYFVPRKLFLFPVQLCEYLNAHKVNTVCWVVSALTMISSFGVLEKTPPRYLRTVAFGSEVFPVRQFNLWKKALPEARFFNLYGPTECTGMSCHYEAKTLLPEDAVIPIGRPFDNTAAFLLNAEGKQVLPETGKESEQGELYLRGTCVTLGYYNDPARTAEAFVQNPLQSAYPELVYRTGDLVKFNAEGELVFLSRKDSQIKHQGHRIELGEIEAAACRMEGVSRACCLYDNQNKRIHLIFEGSGEEAEVKAFLREMLPRYMIPAALHKINSFPLTPNGKIDRQTLKKTYLPE